MYGGGGGRALRESVLNGGSNRGHFEVLVDTGLSGGIAACGEPAMELEGERGEREGR